MADQDEPEFSHLLTPAAVRWSIDELHASTCHSSFLLYLFMRSAVMEGGDPDNVPVDLNYIRQFLWIPGGPVNKPLFRPLSDRRTRQLSQFWSRDHLAGSYAPSSLRQVSNWLLSSDGAHYQLPTDHVERARSAFLHDQPLSALALATFLLRDFGFDLICDDGHPEDAIEAFRDVFEFRDASVDHFDQLFDSNVPSDDSAPEQWFRPRSEVVDG